MKNTNMTESNIIADKMNIYLHMLGALMMNRIRREVHNRDVVTVNNGGFRQQTTKVDKKLAEPGDLGNIISDITIFSLGIGTRSRNLALIPCRIIK